MENHWITEEPKKMAVIDISQGEKELVLKYALDKALAKETFYYEVKFLINIFTQQGYGLHKTNI